MKKWIARFGFFLLVFSFIGLIVGISLWVSIPSKEEIRGCLTTAMFEVKLCPGSSTYVKLSGISNHLKKAVIAAEDSLFYQHKGFDWEAIQSSFEKNLAEGRYVRGGSTITQQLAKNMFLSRNKSLWRKFREALITKEIENTLKKNEILERYLNVVQFGKNLFGVKNAAKFYFKKNPSELSLNESIFLVFLLPSPEKYSHSFFRKELTTFARKRMKTLLNNMIKTGKVSEAEFQEALAHLSYFPGSEPFQSTAEDSLSSDKQKNTQEESMNVPTLEQLESEPTEEN
jgi:monofunctional biosynthetic peptidoglycan transglycosylase